jgi:hypothetical protein
VADFQELQKRTALPGPSPEKAKAEKEKEARFKANSEYTVLVFHRKSSRETAQEITKRLLSEGFQSSNTETDFTELREIQPEDNKIFLTFTRKGQEILSDIEEKIQKLSPGIQILRNPRPIDLRRGDVQVLVF